MKTLQNQALRHLLPQFHDAELISIEISREKSSASLRFNLVTGTTQKLTLSGVLFFRTTDFIPQNVISRLLLSSAGDFSDDDLYRWVRWASSLSGTPSFLDDEKLQALAQRIRDGKLLLLVIEPSWGAEFAAICELITV